MERSDRREERGIISKEEGKTGKLDTNENKLGLVFKYYQNEKMRKEEQ